MIRQAWFCPSCQKHHAPHCDTCPAPAYVGISPFIAAPPVWPQYPQQPSTADPNRIPQWSVLGVGAACVGQVSNTYGAH